MRVALVVHCYFPGHFYGTEAYTRSVALELARRGHEPTVITATFAGEAPQEAAVDRFEHDGIPVIRVDRNVQPNVELRDTYDLPSLRATHERILRHVRPDIVHVTHLVNHTAAFLDVTQALGLPTFATFTDFYSFCLNNKLQTVDGSLCAGPNRARSNCIECAIAMRWLPGKAARVAAEPAFRKPVAALLSAAPRLAGTRRGDIEAIIARPGHLGRAYKAFKGGVAPSRFLQDAYRRNGFEQPLVLSRFGIDIDRRPKPARSDDRLRVGYIGQLAPHKGVHLLLEAVRPLGGRGLQLEIWGDENQDRTYAARLRREAQGLDVAFRGTFPVGEMAAIMAGIDVLAIPSTWHENSPLVLLQALATHTPLIVSDVAGLTEFLVPDVSGLTFPVGDAQALRRLLERFLQDRGLAARMSGTTSYERTTADMVDDLLRLWTEPASPAAGMRDGTFCATDIVDGRAAAR